MRVERAMRDYMQTHYAELVNEIETKKALDKDIESALKAAIEDFKKNGAV